MKPNKSEKVKEHLLKHGSITSWEAIQLFGETRLSSVIYNLREKGYVIESEKMLFEDRFGSKSFYAKYVYKGKVGDEKQALL